MEKKEDEVTKKIRLAIEKKLIEIHAFVDDELPHYIMLLIANKRSKTQFQKDLSLFLGNDTVTFTDWLWNLIAKIRVNSKEKTESEKTVTSKKKENNKKSYNVSDDDSDVLNYNPYEQDGDTLMLEETSKTGSKLPLLNAENRKVNSILPVVQVQPLKQEKIQRLHSIKNIQKSAKVYPVQHSSQVQPSSSVIQVIKPVSRRDDEYDPAKPAVSSCVSSKVQVTKRKFNCPASLQANKLLLRAVNDATKSVLHGQDVKDYYKPTPIKVLSSNQENDTSLICAANQQNNEKHPKSTKNHNTNEIVHPESVNVIVKPQFSESLSNLQSVEFPVLLINNHDALAEQSNFENTSQQFLQVLPDTKRTICLPSDVKLEQNIDLTSDLVSVEDNVLMEDDIEGEIVRHSPHFIVTLDGVDFLPLKRRYSDIEDMEIDEDLIIDEDPFPKKQKVAERCKFWPACKNSDSCLFHHPTVLCKSFPDCKFGDKCLYIHPNCKFDALCSRKDCPYTHASKRKHSLPVKIVKPVKKIPLPPKTVCKFYPKCTAKKCPFVHPKPCRYGTKCRLPVCLFSHFKVPSRNQLKWIADSP